jgi:hypothetical protein
VQASEQRLCLNPLRAYAQVVILTAQKAANQHKLARARRKPVISRYTPLLRGGQEVTLARFAC